MPPHFVNIFGRTSLCFSISFGCCWFYDFTASFLLVRVYDSTISSEDMGWDYGVPERGIFGGSFRVSERHIWESANLLPDLISTAKCCIVYCLPTRDIYLDGPMPASSNT